MEKAITLVLYASYAFLLAFLLNRYLIQASQSLNMSKRTTGSERWASQTKPVLGGISFFCIQLLGVVNAAFFLGVNIFSLPEIIGLMLVSAIAFGIGLADDVMDLSPLVKFLGQILCALLLIRFGIYIRIFGTPALNYLLTILWVVGIMNSINMLDNMDAIVAGVATLIFLFLGVVFGGTMTGGRFFYLVALVSMVAALGGFLLFNWHPSKMYMGDNGSLLLGVMLAVFSIKFLWCAPAAVRAGAGWEAPLLLVWMVFVVPITDTATVTVNRLLKGKSPFVGGRDHTTHHLAYLGLGARQVALVLYGVEAVSLLLAGLLISRLPAIGRGQLALFALYPAAVGATLYTLTRVVKPK